MNNKGVINIGYKTDQYKRVEWLIKNRDVFYGDPGYGVFRKNPYSFVLKTRLNNLYAPIRFKALEYFANNNISWWGGRWPTNHTLSSQIACLNHLFPFRHDKEAVLAIAKCIDKNVSDVLILISDEEHQGYIQFEAVSMIDRLNEMKGQQPTRGSHCTSIDALIVGKLTNGDNLLIVIEWKYTESYGNENKAKGDKGEERKKRYTDLINKSNQLIADSRDIYYIEPFYQLMRQTLWAEEMVRNKESEIIKADDFHHVHVIPPENIDLLKKKYLFSKRDMEYTWRGCIYDNNKYTIISPSNFISQIDKEKYNEAFQYLGTRYWNNID